MVDEPLANKDDRDQIKSKPSSTWDTGKSAFKLIVEHSSPADPKSYAVWYEYTSQSNLDLKTSIDDILARGDQITAAEILQLYETYIQAQSNTEAHLETISRAIQNEVADARSLVTEVISNTDDYVSSMDKARGLLPPDSSQEQITSAIDGIIEQSLNSKQSAKNIQVALESKHDEIIQLNSRVVQLRETLMRDSLTELVNQNKFEALLEERAAEAVANGYSLTVLSLSLKNVAELNRLAGMDISEFILKSFSGIMRKVVKDDGVCARFSGAEFAILLPRAVYRDASKVAKLIIEELETFKIVKKPSNQLVGHIQCAMGGSSLRAGMGHLDLIRAAAAQAEEAKLSEASAVKFDLAHHQAA
ncbi:MAG: diguanylate cyclase [Pseudomonadota bacterium]